MKFARVVFLIAGVWGLIVLTPFYWLVDITGRHYPAPVEYPQFFWGFFSVALAWQIVFLLIGSNPTRFRPLMVPAMLEKFGFVGTGLLLYSRGQVAATDATVVAPDLLLGVLFVAALAATSTSHGESAGSHG
jgi:hypothetical protein